MTHQVTMVMTRRHGWWEGVITSTKAPVEVFHGKAALVAGIRAMADNLETQPEGVTDGPGVTVTSTVYPTTEKGGE